MPALIETVCNTIRQSLESFAQSEASCNMQKLSSDLVSTVTEALNDSFMAAGQAGLASFIQAYEHAQEDLYREGKRYSLKETSTKKFLTLFGEVEIPRRRFCHWQGGPSLVPLDEAWQMQGRYATPEVTENILLAASMLTPTEIEDLFGRISPFGPSAALVHDLINQDGERLGEMLEDQDHLPTMRPAPTELEEASVFVASIDGANVLVREPGKKARIPAQCPGKKHDEQTRSCCYKNAMVGAISFYKQVDEGVTDMETGEPGIIPERLFSIYNARMPEPRAVKFKSDFERTVEEMEQFLPENTIKILLIDGARGLWNYVENNPRYEGYRMLLDFFHSAEHLSALANALFGKDSEEAKRWFKKWRHKLKHEENSVEGLLRSTKRYRETTKVTKVQHKAIATQVTFFKRNKQRMHYADFVQAGFPIGSGPVEAACKTVIKARMCCAGMRWNIARGQNVLNLRVLHKSGHWDTAWEHYRNSAGYHYNSDNKIAA